MKRCLVVILLVGLFLWTGRVQASTSIVLRALAPNPVGSDDWEWIALENTSSASVSAQMLSIKDIEGSVVTYQLSGWFGPGELKVISRSSSGITLNNTSDSVLLLENGLQIDTTDRYEGLAEGEVWVLFADGEWRATSESEYQQMASERVWSLTSPSPSPTPASSPQASSSTPKILSTRASPLPSGETPSPTSNPIDFQTIFSLPVLASPHFSTEAARLELPSPPPLDWEPELNVFMAWKRKALAGSLALIFGGVIWFLIALTRLITWYNEPDPWDAVS